MSQPDPLRVTEDAIQAVAEALYDSMPEKGVHDKRGWTVAWESISYQAKRTWLRGARAALEAALPHLVPKPEGEPSKDALREAFENGRYMERQKQAVDTARPKPEGVEGEQTWTINKVTAMTAHERYVVVGGPDTAGPVEVVPASLLAAERESRDGWKQGYEAKEARVMELEAMLKSVRTHLTSGHPYSKKALADLAERIDRCLHSLAQQEAGPE